VVFGVITMSPPYTEFSNSKTVGTRDLKIVGTWDLVGDIAVVKELWKSFDIFVHQGGG